MVTERDTPAPAGDRHTPTPTRGSPLEVFVAALALGLTSFGGPVAHIGYFERAYVQRRRWLTPDEFAGLVGLCQIVPGPASSQVGFLIGLRRAGWGGAAAAWLGFTLPSALLMFGFALAAPLMQGPVAQAAFHGLKLVAVAVVAQAVWSMARKLCPDAGRATMAIAAAAALILLGGPVTQLVVIALGAIGGMWLCRDLGELPRAPAPAVGGRVGAVAMVAFAGLLVALPAWAAASAHALPAAASIFYRSGALVFGGGHVVLPLLRDALVPSGWLPDGAFLAGYGAAQAAPGPLFTFAAYLGACLPAAGSGLGDRAIWSATALAFIFLPGLLVAIAALSMWNWLGSHPLARGGLAGVNAVVVGVLGAALYDPVWTSAIVHRSDVAIVLVAWGLLDRLRLPPVLVVAFCLVVSVGASMAAIG
jgi:chromate transporter